jgi:hypothetical protein
LFAVGKFLHGERVFASILGAIAVAATVALLRMVGRVRLS